MRGVAPFMVAIAATSVSLAQLAPCSRPISEEQIIAMALRKLSDRELKASITNCGIDFSPTQAALVRLRDVGVTSVVLMTARRKGERQAWDAIKNTRSSLPVQEFLRVYPDGQFAKEASELLSTALKMEEAERRTKLQKMTLVQARQEVADLEARILKLTRDMEGSRQAALAKLDTEYHAQRETAGRLKPKDIFESDADYAERIAVVKRAVEAVDRRHEAERQRMVVDASNQLVAENQELKRQIADLRDRKYIIEGAKLQFVDYDANQERLTTRVDGEEYWFQIPRDRARDLYGRWPTARVAQAFEEGPNGARDIVDSSGGDTFYYPGIPKRSAHVEFLPNNCPPFAAEGQLATFNPNSDCEMRQLIRGNDSRALVHRYTFRVATKVHVTLAADASRGQQRFTPLLLLYDRESVNLATGHRVSLTEAQIEIDLNPGDYIALVTSAGRTGGQYVLELKKGNQ